MESLQELADYIVEFQEELDNELNDIPIGFEQERAAQIVGNIEALQHILGKIIN